MFVVFGFLHAFLLAGKPMWGVPLYFLATILVATLLGTVIARYFSDPMNQWLRGGSGKTS
jgi:peptidoglycan/LPS O-acetylase OafA/YrhL